MEKATMQYGAILPQLEIGAEAAGIRAYAQGVQALGYSHLLAYDHVLGADPAGHPGWSGPYNHQSTFHEPFTLFGYIAGVAPGLELVTGVIILPQRQTALVAKQAIEVDLLTGGRFRLGVGIGWNAVEYEGLGLNFANRARRFEEQIDLLRRLMTEPVLTHAGRYERITAAGLNPLPIQRPIPIWIGGSAEPALKRAAEVADGFFPQRPLAGGWAVTLERMRAWREATGQRWADYGVEARVNAGVGTPDDWLRTVDEWRALGATHLTVNTMGGQLGGPDGHLERLRQVRALLAD
jgi:probable F420-dependent oxidoreductase